ncbi:2Fe-2S iron-sulfur cluster-binding protein [Pseudoneobacillus sp. C159]
MRVRAYTVGSLIPGKELTDTATVRVEKPITPQFELAEPTTPESTVPKMVLQQNGQRYEIQPVKGKLLDAALNQGQSLKYKCRKGTCGQCTVRIINGTGLSMPNDLEKKKLAGGIAGGLRLACQAEFFL